jgi:poly-gamma-glutamate capsule biosynthesis protein CapA/YwtB (metallophosphatase superfamily)
MNSTRLWTSSRKLGGWLAITGIACLAGTLAVAAGRQSSSGQQANPPQGINEARELAMKITAPFTVATAGDIIEMRPIVQDPDPDFQKVVQIVRSADVAAANMENSIVDLASFTGSRKGSAATKEVAEDIRSMGFRFINRANNWMLAQEMDSTNFFLDQAGIVHMGSGKDLQDARAVHYLELPKGRVGMIGMVSTGHNPLPDKAATYAQGNNPGNPGVNPVGLTRYLVLSQDQFEALRKIRDSLYEHRGDVSYPIDPLSGKEPPDQLDLFGNLYKVGGKPGDFSYTMNPRDVRDILLNIRSGKEYSDFMIADIHSHDANSALQYEAFSDYPPEFLIELAHKCIDNGADIFFGHGVHVIRGVEIYKGKPIFYGLSDFVYQLNLTTSLIPREGVAAAAQPGLTPTEMSNLGWAPFMKQANMQGILATSHFEGGHLTEVRLYPLDLRNDEVISRKSTPHLATGEYARQILAQVQERSKPFGTKIEIEGNIGVIRVTATMVGEGAR